MALMPVTQINNWTKLLSTNATDASFPSLVPTTTAPTTATAGVFTNAGITGGVKTSGRLMFLPFSVGADDTTFKMRVYGWAYASGLYIPVLMLGATCTASTAVGVSGATVTASERFSDTIAIVTNAGIANENNWLVSPAANVPAHIILLDEGFTIFQVTFDMNSSASEANCLYAIK